MSLIVTAHLQQYSNNALPSKHCIMTTVHKNTQQEVSSINPGCFLSIGIFTHVSKRKFDRSEHTTYTDLIIKFLHKICILFVLLQLCCANYAMLLYYTCILQVTSLATV